MSMAGSWLLWTAGDGPATAALRRGLNRVLGGLLLVTGLICLSGTWELERASDRLAAAVAGALLVASAGRFLRGPVLVVDLVPGGIAVVVIVIAPDPTGPGAGFTGPLVFTIWLIAAVTNLHPRIARRLLALSAPAYLLLYSVGTGQSGATIFNMVVLNIGMCSAGIGFLGALVRTSRQRDYLVEQATALEIEAALHELEQSSASAVRRLLHDEVISALRAISDLPGDRQDQVRQVAGNAVAAVRGQVAEP